MADRTERERLVEIARHALGLRWTDKELGRWAGEVRDG